VTFTGRLLLLSTDQEIIAAGNVVDAHAQDFVVKDEMQVATTHLEIIRSQYVTPKCWLFSFCVKLQLL